MTELCQPVHSKQFDKPAWDWDEGSMSVRLAWMPERIKPCLVSVTLLVACGALDAPVMGSAGRDAADSRPALAGAGSDPLLESTATTGRETVRIVNERLSRVPIDAKQGGQFIEPLCNLIPSMLAQQVANTSFEEDPPWKVAFRRETDRPHRPWYPDGAVHCARYTLDTNNAYNGRRSLRIELTQPGARAGISQDGYCVKAGLSYRLRLHHRSSEPVKVRAVLHGGGGLVSEPVLVGEATSSWQAASATLRATQSLDNATLTLDAEGPGTVWLDRVSLIGEDAVLGLWRVDVVEAVRRLRPGVIRFGGSAIETYEWDQCLGPSDERAPFVQTYWGGIEENFVGVEEFVQFCREVDAEPLICVRWTGRKPADAAAQVEYFNGAADTPWGQRRVRNGHAEPYGVRYWQIGNEVGGPEYDGAVRAFAEAMRQADPSIRVLSSFPSADTLRSSGGYLDYLCPHHYGCADLVAMAENFDFLEQQIRQFAGNRPVRIAVTEWNTTAADWNLGRASLQTLQNALSCSRYHNLMHRHADSVEIAVRSNLIDSFGSGVILTGPGWLYCAPTYHAQCLYARAAGTYPLRVERRTQDAASDLPWNLHEPDLSATVSSDGRTLRVYGVNSTGRTIDVQAALAGFVGPVTSGNAYVLRDTQSAATAEVLNSRDEPERVSVSTRPVEIGEGSPVLQFAPFSLTLYEFEF
ncbi:MAG: Intracellular exo-alpha-(1-_5)-L-arabinofuranosidase [Verrucomicrobia bacterium ADurb.Bin006]|jgi:alpha-N-arabinofuranosidase|nr:MAG: Intracellular exo-alpha-(1->5)-L-arabinofuranosidase [Verrucomicrobia bacterium ADurb.Bin006]